MTDDEFWKLIACIDTIALDNGYDEAAIFPLRTALTAKSEPDLIAFGELLAQKLYAIDGEEYAQNAGENGCSDDPFLYVRLYVVAKGRKYYEELRSDPKKMPKSIKQWCEALLHPHWYAWAAQTGNEPVAWPYFPSVSYESGSNEELWRPSR
jgi:hypothetical protein